jgi:hypothetical protein
VEGPIVTVLKENKIYNYVNSVVAAPAADPVALDLHETREAKAQRIILDGVKDHLIPHLAEKKTAKEMWDALKNLFCYEHKYTYKVDINKIMIK